MHRALLKAGAAPRPPWPPRNHFYKEEQKGTIDYKGYIPGRCAARQLGMERRVAPSGSAFTRREFVAHYHGTVEWEAAAPVGQWCGENRKGTVLEQQESLPLRFCDRLLLDLGGFAQSLAARVLLTALRSMLLLSVCSLCSSPHKEVLVCM